MRRVSTQCRQSSEVSHCLTSAHPSAPKCNTWLAQRTWVPFCGATMQTAATSTCRVALSGLLLPAAALLVCMGPPAGPGPPASSSWSCNAAPCLEGRRGRQQESQLLDSRPGELAIMCMSVPGSVPPAGQAGSRRQQAAGGSGGGAPLLQRPPPGAIHVAQIAPQNGRRLQWGIASAGRSEGTDQMAQSRADSLPALCRVHPGCFPARWLAAAGLEPLPPQRAAPSRAPRCAALTYMHLERSPMSGSKHEAQAEEALLRICLLAPPGVPERASVG